MRFVILTLIGLATAVGCGTNQTVVPVEGEWRAWLDSPGGPLPFEMRIAWRPDGLEVTIFNGEERIEIPRVEWTEGSLVLGIDHYDSTIVAAMAADGRRLDGVWRRTAGPDEITEMSFHATAGIQDRFITEIVTGGDSSIDGRFSVIFSSATEPAVAVFQSVGGGKIHGTFLTTTGDYRYLAGRFDDGRLRLSCFDGAHAFLFDARMQTDGTLRGDFWSRDTWHETWVASPDAQASVADGFTATSVNPQVRLDTLRYVDLDGAARSPADPIFDGPAKLLVVFGTWCPNCGDATRYLVQLHQRYAGRGLSIVALAFEMTGNLERDIRQVRTYARYHGIEYPVLVAGTSDKALASAAFPLVDRVRAYPTILFIDGKGLVRGVYSGFSGPATGPAHERMKRDFEERIERLLAERPAGA